jgi:hypothetical protein
MVIQRPNSRTKSTMSGPTWCAATGRTKCRRLVTSGMIPNKTPAIQQRMNLTARMSVQTSLCHYQTRRIVRSRRQPSQCRTNVALVTTGTRDLQTSARQSQDGCRAITALSMHSSSRQFFGHSIHQPYATTRPLAIRVTCAYPRFRQLPYHPHPSGRVQVTQTSHRCVNNGKAQAPQMSHSLTSPAARRFLHRQTSQKVGGDRQRLREISLFLICSRDPVAFSSSLMIYLVFAFTSRYVTFEVHLQLALANSCTH